MQKLLIGLGLFSLAVLAYLAFGASEKKSTATSDEGDETRSDSSATSSADKAPSKEFIAPRRMRSRRSLPEDELSDPSLRKMNGMGRGEDFTSNKSNHLAGDRVSTQDDTSDREQRRAEVVARRSKVWLSGADKDSDGLLSPSEAELGSPNLRRVLSDFEAADTNGDGAINIEELKSATALHRKRRLQRRLEGRRGR